MRDISVRVPKSNHAEVVSKLCRMLRSTLRSWPQAKLVHGRGGFGASLGGNAQIYISLRGNLTPQDTRDLLVLFATWLVADPARLINDEEDDSGGVSWMDGELAYLSSGRLG